MATDITNIKQKRQQRVRELMTSVRQIESEKGETREALEEIKVKLIELAKNKELFITDEFQPAVRGTFKDFVAYRLNKPDNTGRALYLSLALPGKESPPHNHNNWAILAGVKGAEINKLYKSTTEGEFEQIDSVTIGQGAGIALMPEDIHSIFVLGDGDEPVWQLRFYQRPLENQTDRMQYDKATGKTIVFPPNTNVKMAF